MRRANETFDTVSDLDSGSGIGLKWLARSALHSIGVVAALRRLSRNGVRILMYHRFRADTRALEQQCEHIRRHYTPVSMNDVAASHRDGRPLPPNSLVVTVDDGYQDFLSYGYPVLHSYRIPATVFLVSDFIDGKLWLWWDAVAYLLEHTREQALTLSMPDGSTRHFGLSSPYERRAAHGEICTALTGFRTEDRVQACSAMAGMLHVDLPSGPTPEYAPLTWGEIRTLAAHDVEFGAHTRTHPILSRVSDPQRLRDEIVASKLRIESEIRRPVIHFCYPNGRREDFTDDAVEVVKGGGFQTAVTSEGGINFRGGPPFLLRRIGVQPDYPIRYFEELLAGVRA